LGIGFKNNFLVPHGNTNLPIHPIIMKNNAAAVAVAHVSHASEKKPTQRLMDSVSDYKSPINLGKPMPISKK
jgi:hypothetical protein